MSLLVTTALVASLVTSVVGNVYQGVENRKLREQIEGLQKLINGLEQEIEKLKQEQKALKIWCFKEKWAIRNEIKKREQFVKSGTDIIEYYKENVL